ncbi:MAG: rhomboid family intramembrane serine protease [Gammaproteobacteria bacterium]|nr:rhomboid family intramembrane serine protease [Gammaproteobacteria bacterium]MBT8133955.1 rhomboid family intramembrane serine protease [Gammaproteobacteria bacterium]NNJ49573.1 rhomboid family intramembrane serine protease [Gammaproteobacteria bacterium]
MVGRYSLLPPVVRALLVLNIAMFVLEIASAGQVIYSLALWPLESPGSMMLMQAAPPFQIWQLVSYSFLHGSVMHLLLNMYALWLFGTRMENVWGSRSFIFYYFFCVVGAGLVQLYVATEAAYEGGIYPTVGASGGVFGLLLGFGLTFPNERLLLIFPPVALPAKWFVLIYGIIELWAGVSGTLAGVAHFAHLGGMLFGFLLLMYWRRNPPG